MACFAAQNLAEQELADVEILAVVDVVSDRLQTRDEPFSEPGGQPIGEDGSVLAGRAQLLNDALLGLVQTQNHSWCCFAHISDSRTE